MSPDRASSEANDSHDQKVHVEEEFTADEYDIVILRSTDSNALESWLHEHDYKIPDGAEQYFRPYVQRGSRFFVAKVDVDRLEFHDGEAELSPLRFHYESEDFRLPIRLGLINSDGTQDLLAFTIAKEQRYEVANRQNVRIPTNQVVGAAIARRFPSFYEKTFSRTTEKQEDAVVTEYAWRAGKCDPCPVDPLSRADFRKLGGAVINEVADPEGGMVRGPRGWTVTRLHYRYGKKGGGRDLVFEKAPPIYGGRGTPSGVPGEDFSIETNRPADVDTNQFQGRYIILHEWDEEMTCEEPRRGHWGRKGGSVTVSNPPPPPPPDNDDTPDEDSPLDFIPLD